MQNLKLLIGVVGGSLVLVLAVAIMFSKEEKPQVYDRAVVVGTARRALTAEMVEKGLEDQVASGSGEAGQGEVVTVVEFSDFQCPACRAWSEKVRQMVSDYGGKVRLVYRHIPLETIHDRSRKAAEAAEAAGMEGKFWQYHDILFERQNEWSELNDWERLLVDYGMELGLEKEQFEEAMGSEAVKREVETDIKDARQLGIVSTPTFFVEGRKVKGDNLMEVVKEAVEKLQD